MRRKIGCRILGLFLTGVLIFESVDFTSVAAETETLTENVINEQETIKSLSDEEDTIEESTTEKENIEETIIAESETVIETESEEQSENEEYNTETVEKTGILEIIVTEEIAETEDDSTVCNGDETEEEETEKIVNESSGEVASGQCGDNLTWTLENGTLTISGTGDMWDYTRNGAPWYDYRNDIGKLLLNEGITKIGEYSFFNCKKIFGVLVIPTGVQCIGKSAFMSCSGFSGDLVIPNSVTDIGWSAFEGCSGFSGKLVISKNINTIGRYVFAGCSGLTGTLEIPDCITIIDMGAFEGCRGLTGSLKIPESVKRIGWGAFGGCNGFSGKWVINQNVVSIESYTFTACNGFTGDLIIPDNIIEIQESAFEDCSGFRGNLIIPKSVKSIESCAFGYCQGINTIIFKGDAPDFNGASTQFSNIKATVYYPSYKDGWNTAVNKDYGGELTWISYNEGTEPWDLTFSEGMPHIITNINSDTAKMKYNGSEYYPFSLEAAITLQCVQLDNLEAYENVELTVELSDGLSFDEDIIQKVSIRQIGIMGNDENNQTIELETIKLYTDGRYATDEFQIKVSVTADGYDKAVTTTLKIPVEREIDYGLYDIQVYSEFANLFIGENQTCAILPAMVKRNEALKNEEGWNFSIENTKVAEIQEYIETEFGPAARIVGKSAGTTKLHIIHIPTGMSVTLTMGVGENILTYELSNIVQFPDNNGIMNYGIFTNNYKSKRVNNGYKVTFDAYNECSSDGAVEVYDAEEKLIDSYEIKRFDRYQTGVKEVFMDGWNLVCSAVNGSLTNVTNSMYTKHTPITIPMVPEGGYIIITNDVTNSVPALVYNTVDVASWMFKEAKALNKWSNEEAFEDKAKGKFCDEIINYFLQQKYEDKPWIQFRDKLTKSLRKSHSINIEGICNLALGIYNNTEAAMHDINIDMKDEIKEAAIDTGVDIAMDVFNEFSPTGEIIETMFGINEALNGFMQLVDINKTIGATRIRIDIVEDNGKLVSEGVIVEGEKNVIPAGTDIIVVDITKEETSRYIIEDLANPSFVTIYNITLYKDKTEIQPNGKIKVKVPLPALYKENLCVIFREEADGSFTNMHAEYSDGYMVFETEHLSKYILYEKIIYSVSFDGNGASSGTMERLSDCQEREEYILPENKYTKDGYLFKEWNTEADGSGTVYIDGAVIKDITKVNGENIVLYAQWTPLPKEDMGDVHEEDIPKDGIIPKGLWISVIEAQIYTGSAIKPFVRVYDYKTLLKEKKDYVISYKNNTKASDAKNEKTAPAIIVSGKGNYTGKEIQTFVILPKDITNEDVMVNDIALKSNSKVQKPVPVITWKGKKLANKRDFIVSYPDAGNGVYKQNGTYKIAVNGIGNYMGRREVTLTITSNKLTSKLNISKIADQPYTGSKIMPKPIVKDGKTMLTENVHYTVSYTNNMEIGTATLIVTGMGEYVGTKQVTFKINAVASLDKANVLLMTNSGSSYTGGVYTGEEVRPNNCILMIVVKDKNGQNMTLILKEGVDYKVSYQNNIKAGMATVFFTGINNYTGTLKKKYKILPYKFKADDNNIKISLNPLYCYTKGGCKPKPIVVFEGKELKEGVDYTLKYKNHTAINNGNNHSKMPTVVIKGKGNFKGSLTKTYQITKADLANLSLSTTDRVWQNKTNIYKTKVVVKDIDGRSLSAGKDYDRNIVYTYNAMTTLADGTVKKAGTVIGAKDVIPADTIIRVTANANEKGCYYGTISGTFRIVKADISKASIKIPVQIYTGKAIEPDDMIEVKLNKQILSAENYEVAGYTNNINKGTATVIIKGKNDCGGVKIVKFRIKEKGFLWWWRK